MLLFLCCPLISICETVDCNHQFFPGEFWDVSVLLVVFNIIVSMVTSVFRSCFAVSLVLSHRSYLSIDLCRISRIHAFSSLNACDRSYSCQLFENILYFLMSFGSFVVSHSYWIFLLISFTWALSFLSIMFVFR